VDIAPTKAVIPDGRTRTCPPIGGTVWFNSFVGVEQIAPRFNRLNHLVPTVRDLCERFFEAVEVRCLLLLRELCDKRLWQQVLVALTKGFDRHQILSVCGDIALPVASRGLAVLDYHYLDPLLEQWVFPYQAPCNNRDAGVLTHGRMGWQVRFSWRTG